MSANLITLLNYYVARFLAIIKAPTHLLDTNRNVNFIESMIVINSL